jgi:hypothetical protein
MCKRLCKKNKPHDTNPHAQQAFVHFPQISERKITYLIWWSTPWVTWKGWPSHILNEWSFHCKLSFLFFSLSLQKHNSQRNQMSKNTLPQTKKESYFTRKKTKFEHQPQKLKNQIVTKNWFIDFILIIKHQMSPSLQTFMA